MLNIPVLDQVFWGLHGDPEANGSCPLSLAEGIYLEHLALQAYEAGCQNFSVPPFHSCPFNKFSRAEFGLGIFPPSLLMGQAADYEGSYLSPTSNSLGWLSYQKEAKGGTCQTH